MRNAFPRARGTTFVETMTVAAVAAGILGALYFFFVNMKGRDDVLSREQEFAQMEARLTLALRLDLRTAREVVREGDHRTVIRRLVPDGEGAETETVVYTFSPGEKRIVRDGRSRTVYDFSDLTPKGKRLVFSIR